MSFETSPHLATHPALVAQAEFGRIPGTVSRSGSFGRSALLIAACAIGLAGCVSAEEQRKLDLGQCSGYGFAPDSEGFATCMMNIDRDRQHMRAERNLQIQADLAAQNREREARADLYKALSQQRVGDKTLSVCNAASGGGFDARTGYWYGKDCRSR